MPTAMYTLYFCGRPIAQSSNWADVRTEALRSNLAVYAFGCLLTLLPGVEIK